MTVAGTIFLIIIAVIVVFLLVLVIRAAAFRPKDTVQPHTGEVPVDTETAVSNLQQLVRCRTESYEDHSLEDDAEFAKLVHLLPGLYPNVFAQCEYTELADRELLFRWKGQSDARASVLMAHYDVVPVEEENWAKPPFEGIIEDGVLWGRGSLDTKVTFNGILTAANTLIGQGFVPKEDIYMAFSGQEEINGPGATRAVEYFRERGIELSMVLDEGGAVVEDVFPGVKERCALIGIAEKGLMNVEYSVASQGGHASAPKAHTPVGILSKAVANVEAKPMDAHLSEPVVKMFDILGRHAGFGMKIIFANLWCFKGLLASLTKKTGGELSAMMRTTVAFTQMQGSKAPNVIPPTASVVSNIRINPGETIGSVLAALRSRIGDDAVELKVLGDYACDPSPISSTDCDGWERVAAAVSGTWEGSIVSPYLMMQCSDSRHYRDYSKKVYKFSAMYMTKEERGLIHGNNERVRLEEIAKATEFFTRVILQS